MTEPRWSTDTGQAGWIAERLSSFGSNRADSVVPGGFDAYARVLHPVREPAEDDALVRWAAVGRWSGLPLDSATQFHAIALPANSPGQPPPWSGQGPAVGNLYLPDAEVIAGLARRWTSTPDRCWFCVWDGYGWGNAVRFTSGGGEPVRFTSDGGEPVRVTDPVPSAIRDGPRVRLPQRDYLLYTGSVDAVGALEQVQTPNLWWPDDRTWCVATEIDLAWTYVAGPAGLIAALLADERIEALPASPSDPVFFKASAWVAAWADAAAAELVSAGETAIETPLGTVRARLSGRGHRTVHVESDSILGHASSVQSTLSETNWRAELTMRIQFALVDLVG